MSCQRVTRIIEVIDREEKAQLEQWMLGLWAQSKASYHGAVIEREIPQTKAEQKRKVFDSAIQQHKKARKEHDAEWLEALSSPQHFGAFLKMPQILGEPPKREERSLKERAKDGYDAGRRALKNLFSRASGE